MYFDKLCFSFFFHTKMLTFPSLHENTFNFRTNIIKRLQQNVHQHD